MPEPTPTPLDNVTRDTVRELGTWRTRLDAEHTEGAPGRLDDLEEGAVTRSGRLDRLEGVDTAIRVFLLVALAAAAVTVLAVVFGWISL